MKRISGILFVLLTSLVNADVSPAQKLEIEHLLNFVQHSSCRINRNGTFYDGSAGASHIQKKYAYFKDDIQTTELFIELCASKSTLSGRYYMVQCGDDRQIKTKQWLLKELKHFRDSNNI